MKIYLAGPIFGKSDEECYTVMSESVSRELEQIAERIEAAIGRAG